MTFEEAEKLINKKHPEDVFGSLPEVDKNYKKLAIILHPDKNLNSKESNFAFAELGKLYHYAKTKISNGSYGIKILATIKSKKYTYDIQDLLTSADLSEVYYGVRKEDSEQVIIKVLRNPANKDLFLNEFKTLNYIRNESPIKEFKIINHIPNIIEHFEINSAGIKKQVTVFKRLVGYYSLSQVKNKYSNGVDAKTAVWIFNRSMAALMATHQSGYIHGAFTPDHFMIGAEQANGQLDHNGILVDFSYSVKRNTKIKAIVPRWKEMYPTEVLEKLNVNFSTDIYMSAKTILYIAERNLPKPIDNFFRWCTMGVKHRPQNAFEVHEDFKGILKTIYGEPRFHPFSMRD
jgi:serine/threonine protein kinase